MKILLLDTSAIYTKVLKDELSKISDKIWIASDEKEAIALLDEHLITLVISGMQLMNCSGIDFFDSVNLHFEAGERKADVPLFLFVSADDLQSLEEKLAHTSSLGVIARNFKTGSFVTQLIEKLLDFIKLKHFSLLIVDDSDVNRQTLKHILDRAGFPILEANDGSQALVLLEQNKENVGAVISDNYMRIMNGIELFEKMRTIHDYSKIPFILLTAETSVDQIKAWRERGIRYFLTKPFSNEDILFEICKCILKKNPTH
jgi:CheY-like chemotaxis protein